MIGWILGKNRCRFAFSFVFYCPFHSDRSNGNTSQKIRTHHEILTRENEKLARQLYQRTRQDPGPANEKRVYVIEEEPVRYTLFVLIDASN